MRAAEVIDMGAQLAVDTGALFSTIGSGWILQSRVPPATECNLADACQLFVCDILSVIWIICRVWLAVYA